MFEYWFLNSEADGLTFTGTTHDFLEVCCRIAENFGPATVGEFVEGLMKDQRESLAFLRVIDWKFEFEVTESETIRLHKLK